MTLKRRPALFLLPLLITIAGCSPSDPTVVPKKEEDTTVDAGEPLPEFEGEDIGTPMEERVAVLGLLNKRTGQSRDIELKPGQALRSGKVLVRLRACERTKPWETFPDEGAFVQLVVRQRPRGTNRAERWEDVFSGWLFKENPSANVVQHPVYDVWVKECRMSFPGEEAPRPSPSARGSNRNPSNAPQSGGEDGSGTPESEDEILET